MSNVQELVNNLVEYATKDQRCLFLVSIYQRNCLKHKIRDDEKLMSY